MVNGLCFVRSANWRWRGAQCGIWNGGEAIEAMLNFRRNGQFQIRDALVEKYAIGVGGVWWFRVDPGFGLNHPR